MERTHTYEYPRPMLTADCVVTDNEDRLLLVQRGNEPFKGCWALPGGFMEMDETLEHCAVRELEEETGLRVEESALRLVGIFSTPGRDPRGRTVTAVYAVQYHGAAAPQAGDDAAALRWWSLSALPPLAFDHAEIVARSIENEYDEKS